MSGKLGDRARVPAAPALSGSSPRSVLLMWCVLFEWLFGTVRGKKGSVNCPGEPDHPFSHPLGFEVLAPLSLRDRWIFPRADRLALHVPAARTSSRHVLDWLRKPFCGGPHWLHQDRIQFWLAADGGRSWDYPDSEEDSEDYNTDGSRRP